MPMVRTTALLMALLAATAFAGCFAAEDDTPAPPPAHDDGDATPPPAGDSGSPPATRSDVTLDEGDDITGPFDKSWAISVPHADYRAVDLAFKLLPIQDGAPVTARVHVQLLAPDGSLLREKTLGVGGEMEFALAFSPGEIPVGEYALRATAEPTDAGAAVPSFGFAKYELHALTDY